MLSFEWGAVLIGSAVLAMIAGFYAAGLAGNSRSRAVEPVRVEVKAARVAVVAPTPPPRSKRVARPSTFRFTATRGDAWLQARSGSFEGRVLYEGNLPQGETVRLRSRRLWIRFGAASHLDVFVNGRRVWLPAFGTFDAFAGPRGVVADRTDYATAAQSP